MQCKLDGFDSGSSKAGTKEPRSEGTKELGAKERRPKGNIIRGSSVVCRQMVLLYLTAR